MTTRTKVMVINPNSSVSMTELLRNTCSNLIAAPGVIEFLTSDSAPKSIEGFSDGALAANGLSRIVTKLENQPSAPMSYVVACFDDTGVNALRELTEAPVIGIGEAACQAASLLGQRFIVMTSLARSISIIENNLHHYGLDRRCSGVFASNLPVLQLESDPSALDQVCDAARQSLARTGAEVLVLGCAGMSRWVKPLNKSLGVPVIDGVSVGIKIAESLVDLGLQTSKCLSYRFPETKT